MSLFNKIPDRNIIVDEILKWIIDIIAVGLITLFLIIYLCEGAGVTGNSMSPVISNGEQVLINKFSYVLGEPERFDVIIYRTEEGTSVKRIIGLPGEEIRIEESKIYIRNNDGEQVLEDIYFEGKFEPGYVDEYVKIPETEYFVMGDNRNVSEDSRFEYVGNVRKKDIIGEVWLIYAPFNRIGFVD